MDFCNAVEVRISEPNYEYDIYSLVKAFFPKSEITMETDGIEILSGHKTITIEYQLDDKTKLYTKDCQNGASGVHFGSICFALYEDFQKQSELKVRTDFGVRLETKNCLKRGLYKLLSDDTEASLPWGTLTGIRPTKILMKQLEEGKSDDEILSQMESEYFAGKEKARLALEVAKCEYRLLQQLDYEKGYSLYIGIPFCPTTCLYCSFTSYPLSSWKTRVDKYLEALFQEIDFAADVLKDRRLNTIYIGGGTPTTLEPEQMDRLLTKLEDSFDFQYLLEFTIEGGRPDSITREKLQVMRDHSISRISINPQTMQQETLQLIGRHHTVENTIESFQLAREMGFTNINMDLIVGLPKESLEEISDTLSKIRQLQPDSLTIHSLAVKRASRLKTEAEFYADMAMEQTERINELTSDAAKEMGLHPYYLYRQKNMAGNFENVGYARDSCEGIYNILIMEEKQTIMALGAGSATKLVIPDSVDVPEGRKRITRVENVKDVTNYLERVDEMIERKRKEMEAIGWL